MLKIHLVLCLLKASIRPRWPLTYSKSALFMQHKKTPKSNGSKNTCSHIYNSTNRCAAHATTSSARPSEQHPGGQPLLWPVWPSPVIREQRQQVPHNWMGVQTRQLTLTGRVTVWWQRAQSQGRRHTKLPQLLVEQRKDEKKYFIVKNLANYSLDSDKSYWWQVHLI